MNNYKLIFAFFLSVSVLYNINVFAQKNSASQIRAIAIFAHPDDADSKMAGTAILLAEMGVAVKFVSLTNGDAGHFSEGGGALAKRRRLESKRAAEKYGIDEYLVLDNHDGELMPDLKVRLQVIREIREWNADIVFGLRPNDYHPDHRNAGKLVEDASYLVAVPNIASDVPALKKNPVFLYMNDKFKKPNPFSHDIAIAIDQVIEKKLNGLNEHVSQYYEWLPWINNQGDLSSVPTDLLARKEWLGTQRINLPIPPEQRNALEKWYGKQSSMKIKHAESFEIAEYGRQPNDAEIRRLFPMLNLKK